LGVASAPARAISSKADGTLQAGETVVRRRGWDTLRYLTQTEVHTYAFSVAANAILSFFPFVVLMLTLTRRLFHSQAMYEIVINLLRDYLPSNRDFVVKNMRALASAHGKTQVFSLAMLLVTSTGIFLPLEVALNRVWGIRKNRSYLANQLLSLGLAFGCGMLAMGSVALTAGNLRFLGVAIGSQNFVFRGTAFIVMKSTAILATILIFFLIYWILPNGRVPWRSILPAAVIAGGLTEGAKYVYIFLLPWLDFQDVYGPFATSVTLMIWAYVSGMLLLGGAHLSASDADRV
jgi:YihY family inner membrane protein